MLDSNTFTTPPDAEATTEAEATQARVDAELGPSRASKFHGTHPQTVQQRKLFAVSIDFEIRQQFVELVEATANGAAVPNQACNMT